MSSNTEADQPLNRKQRRELKFGSDAVAPAEKSSASAEKKADSGDAAAASAAAKKGKKEKKAASSEAKAGGAEPKAEAENADKTKNQKKKDREKDAKVRRRMRDAKMKEKKMKVIAARGGENEDPLDVITKRMKKRIQYKEKLARREADEKAAAIAAGNYTSAKKKSPADEKPVDVFETKSESLASVRSAAGKAGKGQKRKKKEKSTEGVDQDFLQDLARGGSDDESEYEGAENHLGRKTKRARGLGGKAPGDSRKGSGKGKAPPPMKTKQERKAAKTEKKAEKRAKSSAPRSGVQKKTSGKKGKR